MPQNTQAIENAARELAGALQADPRWSAWREARIAAEQDAKLGALMERYSQLSHKAHEGQAAARLSDEEMLELGALQDTIQQNEAFIRRDEASDALIALLREADGALSEALGVDFAANAAPRSSCCGG